MIYTVSPYLVIIEDLKKNVGGKDRALAVAILKKRAEEQGRTFGESLWDTLTPKDEDEAEENDVDREDWNTTVAVKALLNGDFPVFGYLFLADIPKEIKRTKKLKFNKVFKERSLCRNYNN